MKITIKNPSSAGSSFTSHTCNVICQCYEYAKQNLSTTDKFIDFRKSFADKTETNDNNNRNIFPFLKYAGFITYDNNIEYDKFFTNLGVGFIRVMHLQDCIEKNVQDELLKAKLNVKLNVIKKNLIGAGLRKMLKCNECRYRRELIATIKFLYKYHTINIEEFAFLMYSLNEDEINFLDNMEEKLKAYRKGYLEFEVIVEIRGADGNFTEADISRLTAYGYYIALLNQAGVISKDTEGRINLDENSMEYITSLIEE